MTATRLYWWSPVRSARLAAPEIFRNPAAWARLGLTTSRWGVNFGDELSKHVVEYATGRRARWSTAKRAELVAIGSILETYTYGADGADVWGSGLLTPPTEVERTRISSRLGRVLAVRGPLTRDALQLPETTPLGDPGVLASAFVRSSDREAVKRPTLVPHFRAWAGGEGRRAIKASRVEGFVVAPPTLSPREMIVRIHNSSFVATSSLHGLILAHSLGVPAQLISFGEHENAEASFKYDDYASSVDAHLASVPVGRLLSKPSRSTLIEAAEVHVSTLRAATARVAENLLAAAVNI